MKNLYIAIITFLAITIVSCEKNEGLLIPQDFSDFAYTVADGYRGNAAGDTNYIESPIVASFMHLSRGAMSHEWVIEEGCHFLSPDFSDDVEDYTPYIIEGETLAEDIAFVLFDEVGTHNVTLRSFFEDSIPAYKPSEFETYTCFWNQEKGAYEMKVDFVFVVMEDVNMAFDVFGLDLTTPLASVSLDQTGKENPSNWPTVNLIEGDSITIKFTEFKGDPMKAEFFHEAGETSIHKDSVTLETSIIYRTPGEYEAGTVIVSRRTQDGIQMPPSEMEKTIPLHIVVSEKPYEATPILFKEVVGCTSTSITLRMKEIAADSILLGENAKNDFTVTVNNVEAGLVSQAISVADVTVDSLDITLTFAETVYSDDVLSLVYTNNGNITDDKSNQLQAFSVTDYAVPTLSVINDQIYDFETGAWTNKKPWSLVTEKFMSGATSLKYNNTAALPSGVFMTKLADQATITTPLQVDQTYDLSFWIYLETGCDVEVVIVSFNPSGEKVPVDVSQLPKDQWVACKAEYVCKTATTEASFIQLGVSKAKTGIFYIDDINLTQKNNRPK